MREMADVSTLSIVLAVVLGGLLLLLWRHYSPVWRGVSKSGARLPKGSLGWPIMGETFEFARNPATYAVAHFERYGNIWKASTLLERVVMGTTPEFAKFVTSNDKLFASKWPKMFRDIVGPKAFIFKDGPPHMSVKKLLLQLILPEALRTQVNTLEAIVLETMASWEQKGTVNARAAMQKLTSDTGFFLLLGFRNMDSTAEGRKAQESFVTLTKALASLPVNLPGTPYNKGLKAKAALTQYIQSLLEKRKGKENPQSDILGVLLAAQEDAEARGEIKDLDDDTIVDNIVFVNFAAYDSTSLTLTWVLKTLVDNPDVFRRIQAEQQEILRSKDPSVDGPRLTWEDTRNMAYTQKFFQELQRYLSIVPVIARQATEDVVYEGHLIPKGWGVRPLYTFIHSDPATYPDPKTFNPDRFDVTPKPYTYLPFSTGPHFCPGMEVAKLLVLIFIHHITTTYTYERAGEDMGVECNFFFVPTGGYPIHIRRQK